MRILQGLLVAATACIVSSQAWGAGSRKVSQSQNLIRFSRDYYESKSLLDLANRAQIPLSPLDRRFLQRFNWHHKPFLALGNNSFKISSGTNKIVVELSDIKHDTITVNHRSFIIERDESLELNVKRLLGLLSKKVTWQIHPLIRPAYASTFRSGGSDFPLVGGNIVLIDAYYLVNHLVSEATAPSCADQERAIAKLLRDSPLRFRDITKTCQIQFFDMRRPHLHYVGVSQDSVGGLQLITYGDGGQNRKLTYDFDNRGDLVAVSKLNDYKELKSFPKNRDSTGYGTEEYALAALQVFLVQTEHNPVKLIQDSEFIEPYRKIQSIMEKDDTCGVCRNSIRKFFHAKLKHGAHGKVGPAPNLK